MIGFHVPSFAIDSGDGLESQGGIAGHQIQNTDAAIFVCEDLLDQQQREIDTFQIDRTYANCIWIAGERD